MKIRAAEIRERGPLDIADIITADSVALDAPDGGVLAGPVKVRVHAEADAESLTALITAEGAVVLPCSRCLEKYRAPLAASFDAEVPLARGEMNVADEVRQAFLLALPPKPLCRADCRGLCPRCGKNLNGGPCACPPEGRVSPFDVLKNIRIE
jgi:uncharacterized protein